MPVFGPLYQGDERARAALAALLARAAVASRRRRRCGAVLRFLPAQRRPLRRTGRPVRDRARLSQRAPHAGARRPRTARWRPTSTTCRHRHRGGMVRCKYAVLSMADLERGVSRDWFESYLWGRFCQPVAVANHRDEATLARVRAALRTATITFLDRTLPGIAAERHDHGTVDRCARAELRDRTARRERQALGDAGRDGRGVFRRRDARGRAGPALAARARRRALHGDHTAGATARRHASPGACGACRASCCRSRGC